MNEGMIDVGQALVSLAKKGFADDIDWRDLKAKLNGFDDASLLQALHGLKCDNYVKLEEVIGKPPICVYLLPSIYAEFASSVFDFNPNDDARILARVLLGVSPVKTMHAKDLNQPGWSCLRLNAALSLIVEQLPSGSYRNPLPREHPAASITVTPAVGDILDQCLQET